MNRRLVRAFVPLVVSVWAGCASAPESGVPAESVAKPERNYSKLWGQDGEFWLVGGRLPDFSFAGYRNGDESFPDYPEVLRVEAFGAKGDGKADDTAAFRAALAAAKPGTTVLVPAGRFVITDVLTIAKPRVVLRGAGPEKTILHFPKPLDDVRAPARRAAAGESKEPGEDGVQGFVRIEGELGSRTLTTIVSEARRGDQVIAVADATGLVAGQEIEVRVTDTPENSLVKHLYSDEAGDVSKMEGKTTASLVTKIMAVEGNWVHLQRRLRFDLRPEWKPVVRTFEPTVHDSGVEGLAFEYPAQPYAGHGRQERFDSLVFDGVAHCWGRELKFVNANNGPKVEGAFNTVADVVFAANRPADIFGNQGHHGVFLRGLGDHVFTRFEFRVKFVHDITVSGCAGVVVSQGRGVDLCFDLHDRAPYDTLFAVLDMGKGIRPWNPMGTAGLGKSAGARMVFWNLHAAGPLPEPPRTYAPWSMSMVGVDLGRPASLDPLGVWREFSSGETVWPTDLHEAQLERRRRAVRGVTNVQ